MAALRSHRPSRLFPRLQSLLHGTFPCPAPYAHRSSSAGAGANEVAGGVASSPIPRVRCPSLEEFKRDYYDVQMPAVIEGAMENWNARSWTVDTIAKRFGDTTVHVELSRWNEKERRWGDFRDLYMNKASVAGEEVFLPQHAMQLDDFIEIFLKKQEDATSPLKGYLAQQQEPFVTEGILDPEYAKLGKGIYQRNVWLGPEGTVTPLHRDPYHNVLAQIWGKKYIRLYSPTESAKLYPFKTNLYLRNTSQVDIGASNAFERWPELQTASFYECILNAGEMIYVPIKWWHYVRANEPSFSVSFWSV